MIDGATVWNLPSPWAIVRARKFDRVRQPPPAEADGPEDKVVEQGRERALTLLLGFPALFTTLMPWLFRNAAKISLGGSASAAALVFTSFIAIYFVFPLTFVALRGFGVRIWRRSAIVVLACLFATLIPALIYLGPRPSLVGALALDVSLLALLLIRRSSGGAAAASHVPSVTTPTPAVSPTRGGTGADGDSGGTPTPADPAGSDPGDPSAPDPSTAAAPAPSLAAGPAAADSSSVGNTGGVPAAPPPAMAPDPAAPARTGSPVGRPWLHRLRTIAAGTDQRLQSVGPRYAFPAILLVLVVGVLWLWMFPLSTFGDFQEGFALSPVVRRGQQLRDEALKNWQREAAVLRLAANEPRASWPAGGDTAGMSRARSLVLRSREYRDSIRTMSAAADSTRSPHQLRKWLLRRDSAHTKELRLLVGELNPDSAPLGAVVGGSLRGDTAASRELVDGVQGDRERYSNHRVQAVLYLSDIYDLEANFTRGYLARLYDGVRKKALVIVAASVALLLLGFFYEFGPGAGGPARVSGGREEKVLSSRRDAYHLGFAVLLFMLVPLVQPIEPEDIDPARPLAAFTLAQWHLPSFVYATVTGTNIYTDRYTERSREVERFMETSSSERTRNTVVLVDTVPARDTIRVTTGDTIIDPVLRARVDTLSSNIVRYRRSVDSMGAQLRSEVREVLGEVQDSPVSKP
jgi:hypothetical protein